MFNNVKDNLFKLALASAWTHGSSTTVSLASGLGASLPAAPCLLTLVKQAGYGTDSEVSRVFAVSGIAGDVVTMAVASGYADDVDFATGDYAEVRIDAQSINDLNSAVSALQTDVAGLAPLASPALTGSPTAPTPATADNSTAIATTAFVKAQGYLTTAPVSSVAGRTGAVVLAAADVSGLAPSATTDATTTASITDSTNKRFVTDAQVAVLGNTSGTNTGDQTSVSGNAGTATRLATARTINGVSFDGSGNVTVPAAAGTLTGSTLAAGVTSSSLTQVGTLANLTVTNPIAGSVTGNAGTVTTINGRITAGTNVTITGSGTAASPYSIAASGGGGGSPGGSSGQIQYNSAGAFGGASKLAVGSSGQLNQTAIAAPGSPVVGDLWYDSSQYCRAVFEDGLTQYVNRTIYVQNTNVTKTAVSTESMLSATNALGSTSFPAGFLNRLGRTLTVTARGYGTPASSTPGQIVFYLKFGGTLVAVSNAINLSTSGPPTNAPWQIRFTIRTSLTGSAGNLDVSGFVLSNDPSGSNPGCFSVANVSFATGNTTGSPSPQTPIAVDLTAALAFDLQWRLYNSGNSFTVTQLLIEAAC